jgi:hypothetical protein
MLLLEDDEMDRVRLSMDIRRELLDKLPGYVSYVLEQSSRALERLDIASLCMGKM